MTEYYRVRTPEQWDWLVNRFGQSETQWPEQGMSFEEIRECLASGGFVIVHNDYFPGVGSVLYTATPQNNGNVIEVSDLMEDEKMEDYVTIKDEDLNKVQQKVNTGTFISDEDDTSIDTDMVKELIIPKSLLYPKVRMAEADKKEFDMAAGLNITPIEFLEEIESSCGDEYPCLFNKMFCSQTEKDNSKAQIEFIRAFADPSITIELIKSTKQ